MVVLHTCPTFFSSTFSRERSNVSRTRMSGSAGIGVSGSVEREKAVRGGKLSKRVRSERKAGKIRALYGCRFMTRLRRRCSGHAALLTLLIRSCITGVAGPWPSFAPLPIPNSITLYHKPVWRQSLSRQGSAGVQNTPPPNQMHTPPARRRAGHPAQTQPCLCSHTDASLPRQGLHA